MKITGLEEYGLRCILKLANVKASEPLAASAIAEDEGISVEYVRKFMFLLRKANLVKAVRGIQGGFALNKPADKISIKAIFDALRKEKFSQRNFCHHFPGHKTECVHMDSCSVRPIWTLLFVYFDNLLSDITLADLLRGESEVKTVLQTRWLETAEKFSDQMDKGLRKVKG